MRKPVHRHLSLALRRRCQRRSEWVEKEGTVWISVDREKLWKTKNSEIILLVVHYYIFTRSRKRGLKSLGAIGAKGKEVRDNHYTPHLPVLPQLTRTLLKILR